jgi:hypothetical protein
MLDVAYEAATDLAPGRLAQIDEDRGTIRVRLDKHAPLADVVRQLNTEIERLMSSSHWFQLWGTEIVSRDTPNSPLRVEYILKMKEPRGAFLEERKGLVSVFVDPALDTEQFAAAMNSATEKVLAGGHWFQLFGGEIIDNSPEQPMSRI